MLNGQTKHDSGILYKDSKKISIPIQKPESISPMDKTQTITNFEERVKLSDISKSRNRT